MRRALVAVWVCVLSVLALAAGPVLVTLVYRDTSRAVRRRRAVIALLALVAVALSGCGGLWVSTIGVSGYGVNATWRVEADYRARAERNAGPPPSVRANVPAGDAEDR